MSVDLDHLIVFCSAGAPEAEDLVGLGLTEGSPNIHTGQICDLPYHSRSSGRAHEAAVQQHKAERTSDTRYDYSKRILQLRSTHLRH